jgi:hypothetical protein
MVLLLAASSIARGLASAGSAAAGPVTTPPKVITRDLLTDGATLTVVDSRTVGLSVNETSNLRGLQQVEVSWAGAHPTGGNVADPNSVDATSLEYPMVLLECRGVDAADAPAAQQISPDTCWTSSPRQRYSQDLGGDYGFPPWRVDEYAAAAQRKAFVGVEPQNYPGACSIYLGGSLAQYWLPFAGSNGHVYPGGPNGCAGQPPEAVQNLGNLTFPSNETFAVTARDGSGSSKFVVHTSDQNASLGCSDTVACALVAIPIMGISCDVAALGLPVEDRAPTSTLSDPTDPTSPPIDVAALAQSDCTKSGHLSPGTNGSGGDDAVSGVFWWAASNWRNRITVPLNFAPVGDACATTGKNGGVEIYGSELLTEATTQWGPHFCANDQLFNLKHVQLGEPLARNLLAQNLQHLQSASDKVPPGNVEAAFASYAPTGTYSTPVVKAPVALTGFAISFAMDDASGHEMTSLNLNARLVAKLLTESYPSSRSLKQSYSTTVGNATSTVLRTNPLDMAEDPEFRALNPTAPQQTAYLSAASTLYALSADSDVMYGLTSYIVNDPEARAWLAGAPDPWGMRVNPHYATGNNEISWPTASWRLLDPVPDATSTDFDAAHCSDLAKVPYLPLVAAAASSLAKIALAVQFSYPLSTSACQDVSGGLPTPIYKPARVGREGPGTRFMLGVTSLGEASRYQLSTASLQTQVSPVTPTATPADFKAASRTLIAPTDASLKAAGKLLVPDTATGTWQIPPDAIRTKQEGAAAYPGTMVVTAQVPTLGLPATDASRYAQFLTFAAGDGQTPGTGNGQLPPGYLPMTAANGLGSLADYTRLAAAAVERQTGDVPPIVPGQVAPPPSPSGSASGGSPQASAGGANGASPTSTASAGGSSPSPGPFTALGPGISGGRTGAAQAPVNAPGGVVSGVLGAIGKTLGIISRVAGSIVWWLLCIAAGALAGAAVFWGVARRRGVRLGLKSLLAAIKEWLLAAAGRRRAPR